MAVSVQQFQPLTLECVISGSPVPAAKWLKNGKEVAPRTSHPRQNNNLSFEKVTRRDEGSYTCAADTEQGTVVSANYTVNVLGKKEKEKLLTVCGRSCSEVNISPFSSTEPVFITDGLTNQLVSPHSSARFACTARGNPSPNVTWLFNADPIAPSQRVQLSGPSLVIKDVTPQDEGVYQCLLDNGIGSAQSYGILTTHPGMYLPGADLWACTYCICVFALSASLCVCMFF